MKETIDLPTILEIVHYEASVELWQTVLMYACLAALAVLGVILAGHLARKFLAGPFARLTELVHRDKSVLILLPAVVALCLYGGSKGRNGMVSHSGADTGIGLVFVTATTNSVPNLVVEVGWTNGTVTADTPVSVRNAVSESWTELDKLDPVEFSTEGTTNVMKFAVSGTNYLQSVYWYVGSSKPPVVVSSSDISIVAFVASSTSVRIVWTCSDPNCVLFSVEMSDDEGRSWTTMGNTQLTTFTYSGFTVGKTRWWRVTSSYTRDE